MSTGPHEFRPRVPGTPQPPKPLMRPRRVRGGVKLRGHGIGDAPPGVTIAWAAQRWGRYVEGVAQGEQLREGLEYAQGGQAKRLGVARGLLDASVQGRALRPYTVRLEMPTIAEEQWGKIIDALGESAIYSAKLLSGEIPANIEDLFGPLGLRLFPLDADEVKVSCTCAPGGGWCKHACCVAHLFSDRLRTDPFLIFLLRGMDGEDLRERLRQRRATAGAATGSVVVYAQRVAGASDAPASPMDHGAHGFWDAGPGLRELDLPIARPAVSHPILRRLGPSPFQGAKFPLVGLLASCYEAIREEALKEPSGEEGSAAPSEGDQTPDTESDGGSGAS